MYVPQSNIPQPREIVIHFENGIGGCYEYIFISTLERDAYFVKAFQDLFLIIAK